MPSTTLAEFLLPEGFAAPRVGAVLREGSAAVEIGRFAMRAAGVRRTRRATPYAERGGLRLGDPVLLVPGFLAGDGTLSLMARALRHEGFRTYRSHIHANIGCTQNAAAQLEARLESIAIRRDSRVQVVGHSLGGMLAHRDAPTWSPTSSRWVARCWRPARTTGRSARASRCWCG